MNTREVGGAASEEFSRSPEARAFIAHIYKEEILGVLIRGHLYIEEKLTALIERNLRRPKKLKLEKKSFSLKIELAVALASEAEVLQEALVVLNRLRNRLSHNLRAKITRDDCVRLYKALPIKVQSFEVLDLESELELLMVSLTVLFGFLAGMLASASGAQRAAHGTFLPR